MSAPAIDTASGQTPDEPTAPALLDPAEMHGDAGPQCVATNAVPPHGAIATPAKSTWLRGHLGPILVGTAVLFGGTFAVERVLAALSAAQEEVARIENAQTARAQRIAIVVASEAIDVARSTGTQAQMTVHIRGGAVAGHVRTSARRVAERTAPTWTHQTWVPERDTTRSHIVQRFALTPQELQAWNPDLVDETVPAGTRVTVFRYQSAHPPVSLGVSNRGRLYYGVPLPAGPYWQIRNPARVWGTEVAVDAIMRGFTHVGTLYPDTAPVHIGDLSNRLGGRMRPHKSHQSGRDVDGAFYNRVQPELTTERFHDVYPSTLDVARQWSLFRYWIENDDVEMIFVERRLIAALYLHAQRIGTDAALLRRAFGSDGRRGILSHEPGHRNHFHARFRCAEQDTRCR